MADLFTDTPVRLEEGKQPVAPLADRMRPRTLDRLVGQDHILGEGKPLRRAIEMDEMSSLILWGPPGSGKTSLAQIIAEATGAWFTSFSAVNSGVKEIRETIARAKDRFRSKQQKTILFVDEFHRFNKLQQDSFLPYIEDGTIVLIGATTENPSFEANAALLSRSSVFVLHALSQEDIERVLLHALDDPENGLGGLRVQMEPEALDHLAQMADGDARRALNALELVASITALGPDGVRHIALSTIEDAVQRKALLYDRAGEEHYNLISALHKSLRGSDPDAALYWLARMLDAGEDPLYLARRMVRFASEDVGNADPKALTVALAAKDAFHFIGRPEGDLALAQAAVYLATAPKSNALYTAYERAKEDAQHSGSLPVPLHIRNAPTRLMKELEYGKDYQYAHDFEHGYVAQEYLPEALRGRKYYEPTEHGHEKWIKERMAWWAKLKADGWKRPKGSES